mgnify:CR=1 FL=1
MITTKDKIGYIRRSTDSESGKETFKFIEAKIKRISIGKNKSSIYTDKFYALDLEEVESNTKIISRGSGLMLVGEPFITTPEYSEHCVKVVEYWNEHGAESILDR